MINPNLEKVNTRDPEECDACGDWLCAYHEGFNDGANFMGQIIQAAVKDPERVHLMKWESF